MLLSVPILLWFLANSGMAASKGVLATLDLDELYQEFCDVSDAQGTITHTPNSN
jgi:hypothetical protein